MTLNIARHLASGLLVLLVAACGGGSDPAPAVTPPVVTPPTVATVKDKIATAAAVAGNDTSTNADAAFSAVQAAGVPAVSVNSPPKINFSVFSDGAVKTGLTTSNARFIIAKLVPGTNGDPDQWVSYTYRKETAKAGVGPNGTPVLASAMQATTDSGAGAKLDYNDDGYYTYTFATDIKDTTKTNGVVFEPNRTHRIAIQLSYKNAAGEDVRVNPYFDFTIDANGNSVPVTDPAKTRKMTDVSSCNGCHEKLALHGGGRVDTQYCVMCHNPGTTDANSGNVLTLSTMAHKIHSGKLLKSKLAAGGEDYTIWGYGDKKHDYAEVGFPQDLRNCTVCHNGANPKTPQGDNWKTQVSKTACLTCHANNAGSDWDTSHVNYAVALNGAGALAKGMTNAQCVACHKSGTNLGSDRVHWNQNEENAAKYKMNIESATYDATTRKVTVKYYLSDPTNGNAAYNLVTADCTYTGTASPCVPPSGTANNTQFGNLRFVLGYQNMVGQLSTVTEFSAYNSGGNGVSAYLTAGTNDGNNHYTVQLTAIPADTATAVASGTARVVSYGQIKEPKLQVKWATDPRPEIVPRTYINTVMGHTYMDVALTGTLQPRRQVVSNEKCNVCHGALGTTSGSNTLSEAFHGGARNTVEACVVCHDPNRMSSTVMTSGLTTGGMALQESYQFKRMIHGIHGSSKRTSPYTHGNPVLGIFTKAGELTTTGSFVANKNVTINGKSTLVVPAGTVVAAGETFETINQMIDAAARGKGYTNPAPIVTVENYAAEVAYPQVGLNCNACHVNNSYKTDKGTLGAVVFKDSGVSDPNLWKVISPKAASCTGCHDSSAAIGHVTSFGGASFGNLAQGSRPQETCDDCHAPGGYKGVDLVHGQK